jgi:hypothetical protein
MKGVEGGRDLTITSPRSDGDDLPVSGDPMLLRLSIPSYAAREGVIARCGKGPSDGDEQSLCGVHGGD